jgi:hypothetical protein
MVWISPLTVAEANEFVSDHTGGEVGVIQDGAGIFLARKGFGKRIALKPDLDMLRASLLERIVGWKTDWPA